MATNDQKNKQPKRHEKTKLPQYNPFSEAGYDDAVDPIVAVANQGYKHAKATKQNKALEKYIADRRAGQGRLIPVPPGMNFGPPIMSPSPGKAPMPLNLLRLGAGTVAGIVAESTAQQAMNATRGGQKSNNPYIKNLEKLGSRMIGGATTGAIYGGPPGAIAGAAGGAAVDIADNVIEAARIVPQVVQLAKDKQDSDARNKKFKAKEKELAKTFDDRIRDSIRESLSKEKNPVRRSLPKIKGIGTKPKHDPMLDIMDGVAVLDNSSAYNTGGAGFGSGVAGFFTRDGKVIPITA